MMEQVIIIRDEALNAGTKLFFKKSRILEFFLWGVILLLFNRHLFTGVVSDKFIFYPQAVAGREWWRILTHPLVHVSWYHFLLDAAAFLLLYFGLEQKSLLKKIIYVLGCVCMSFIIPLLTTPDIYIYGLCGLSGAAHGLMAISALELISKNNSIVGSSGSLRKAGFFYLGMVLLKSSLEFIRGEVVFSFLHFGYLGSPIASSHLGGVLGGILVYMIISSRKS